MLHHHAARVARLLRQSVSEFSTKTIFPRTEESASLAGIVNGLFELQPGQVFHVARLSRAFRGLSTFHFFLLINNPTSACLDQIISAQPPVTQVTDTVPAD